MNLPLRASGVPRAFNFARRGSPNLAAQHKRCVVRLKSLGRSAELRGFSSELSKGRPAINMKVGTLLDFITSGEYLNVYEVSARQAAASKMSIVNVLKEKLGPIWYKPRIRTDRLLGMNIDSHYAFLNIGGAGPIDKYGPCSVVLDDSLLRPHGTAFAGDSIKSIFDKRLRPILTKRQALDLLATASEATELAILAQRLFIERSRNGIDLRLLRKIIEAADSLLELHIHGPIRRQDIVEVVMEGADHDRLWTTVCDMKDGRIRPPFSWKYDEAIAFAKLVKVCARHSVVIKRI